SQRAYYFVLGMFEDSTRRSLVIAVPPFRAKQVLHNRSLLLKEGMADSVSPPFLDIILSLW
ncbi:MAG: hypothetical protein MJ230_03405, partial [bacterium]|nr:hypothetical protein [bacterium]